MEAIHSNSNDSLNFATILMHAACVHTKASGPYHVWHLLSAFGLPENWWNSADLLVGLKCDSRCLAWAWHPMQGGCVIDCVCKFANVTSSSSHPQLKGSPEKILIGKVIQSIAPPRTSFTPSSWKTASYCSAALLQVNSAAAAMAACFIFTTCGLRFLWVSLLFETPRNHNTQRNPETISANSWPWQVLQWRVWQPAAAPLRLRSRTPVAYGSGSACKAYCLQKCSAQKAPQLHHNKPFKAPLRWLPQRSSPSLSRDRWHRPVNMIKKPYLKNRFAP